MLVNEPHSPGVNRPHPHWGWIVGIILIALLIVAAVVGLVISRAEPILRGRVIETLSTRFKSRVDLDGFHVSLHQGVQVSGEGLKIYGETDPNAHQPGIQPIIAIAEFRFRTGVVDLLRSPMHVNTVYVKGLRLNLPPKEQRSQNMVARAGKIKIYVDQFICEGAQLVINTLKPGKLPLDFDIASLVMKKIGPGQPLHFDANLTNQGYWGNSVIHRAVLRQPEQHCRGWHDGHSRLSHCPKRASRTTSYRVSRDCGWHQRRHLPSAGTGKDFGLFIRRPRLGGKDEGSPGSPYRARCRR